MVDVSIRIKEGDNKLFDIIDNHLYSFGELVPDYIAKKVFQFMEEDLPFEYLINFWNNLKENPSENSREQTLSFLESNDFPLTSDGMFIAYKMVRSDYLDDYTAKLDNTPGKWVTEDRSLVVDDPTKTCAKGLHIAPFDYAQLYKGLYGNDRKRRRLIELLVNPRDVVSVPYNYEDQKARVCAYYVLKDVTHIIPEKDVVYIPDIPDSDTPDLDTTDLTDDDMEKVSNIINDNKKTPIKLMRIGNKKYEVHGLSRSDYIKIPEKLVRKKSKWAKAFINEWGNDIIKVERSRNIIIDKWEYIVTLKNDVRFYIISKKI
jgi:hypothetical protein